jgi:hypothetical protein
VHWTNINNVALNAEMIEAIHKIVKNPWALYCSGFVISGGQALHIGKDTCYNLGTSSSSAMIGTLFGSVVCDEMGKVATSIVAEPCQIARGEESIAIDKDSDVCAVELLLLRQL